MNVLMLVKTNEVGGVLSCVKSLTDGLRKAGDEVVIGACAGEGVDKMLADYHVEFIDFFAKTPRDVLKVYRQIAKIVKEYKIDIIHTHNRIPALYAAGYCFFHRKIKYIWSNHLVPLPNNFKYRIMTRYGKFAVAEGINGYEFLVNSFKIPEKKVRMVNLGSPLEKFKKTTEEEQRELKQKLGITENKKIILLYGRLTPSKGHLFLLESLAKLSKKYLEDLIVIFPGVDPEYQKKVDSCANKYGLNHLILYPGYINGQEYLSISDLMILPSKREGFGIVNVEAFAMGVPVIRTKTAGYRDMQDCCFGVEYADTEQLAEYIGYLWSQPEKLQEMAEKASANVYRFSIEKMTEEYKKIYKECL